MKSAFPKNLNDRKEYRPMVRWFSPLGLLKTLEQIIPSTLFGKYADARLMHAALNAIAPDTIIEMCCGGTKGIFGAEERDAIYVDYVADLGDGFNPTYAIAYMIGQQELQVDGKSLPRADCLIMGGDEVYPDANRDDYHKRMLRPYKAAFPITESPDAVHPPLYMIPGNHDWYDGLGLFSALFCSGHNNTLGSWKTPQTRSYFATHLCRNWWIWGFDSQLAEDVDGPQSDYFDEVGKRMSPESKVIFCASVPTWSEASMARDEGTKRFERGVHFIASKLYEHCPSAKLPLVIAGDTHHYNRYEANQAGTQFITAGGGGAFLHPTHKVLRDTFDLLWLGRRRTTLSLGVDGNSAGKKPAIYPEQETSQRLALQNVFLAFQNWDFSLFLGGVYALLALFILWWRGYGEAPSSGSFPEAFWHQVSSIGTTPIFVVSAGIFFGIFLYAADKKSKTLKWFFAPLHSLSHGALLLLWTSLASTILAVWGIRSVPNAGDILYFLFLIAFMTASGFVGATFWGMYLTLASYLWGADSNNAFSALRLDSYKHFIRLKLEPSKLTIYPIAIDSCPKRDDWQFNPDCEDENQNTPVIAPKKTPKDIGQHFIEKPIEIDLDDVPVVSPGSKA